MLKPEPKDRPTINHILKHDLIAPLARKFLTDDQFISEFSHTVLHNQNIFAETKKLLADSVEKSPPKEKKRKRTKTERVE